MDFVKNKSGLYIIIIVLVIVNIVSIGFLWYGKIRNERNDIFRMQAPPPRLLLEEELGFTSEQVEKFESLRNEHRKITRTIQEEIKTYKDSLFDNIKSGNDERAKEISIQIADRQKEQEFNTYKHFKAIRGICDDKQKEKFDLLIRDIAKSMEQQRALFTGSNPPPPEQAPPPKQERDSPPKQDKNK